jgi:hypothetical protein
MDRLIVWSPFWIVLKIGNWHGVLSAGSQSVSLALRAPAGEEAMAGFSRKDSVCGRHGQKNALNLEEPPFQLRPADQFLSHKNKRPYNKHAHLHRL